MKTCKVHWLKILPVLLVFFYMGCKDTYLEDEKQTLREDKVVQLNRIWDQLNLEAGVVIVQQGESIQEAVRAARSGNTLYIEPGIYRETIAIDKEDIRFIGLSIDDDRVVIENPGKAKAAITMKHPGHSVEISGIQFRNFKEGGGPVSHLKHGGFKGPSPLLDSKRNELGGGLAHYQYKLRVGEGEFDVVRLHRVVKEQRPYRPVKTKGEIFLIHGAPQDFGGIFLRAGADVINENTSPSCYLANRNIDVWGIDLGWTLVPAETSDFSFMKDWGFEKEVDHTLAAMAVTRLIRGLTRQSFQRMNLLGYCSGSFIVYGAAGRESQMHPIMRHIKGIIPVDYPVKYDNKELQKIDCQEASDLQDLLNAGVYHNEQGQMFVTLSTLALNAPDDPSPVPDFNGLTNRQVMMLVGTSPNDPVTQWQFFGGSIDTFYHTDPVRFFRLGASTPPYMPVRMLYDGSACGCDQEDVSIDDHIGEISLPVLNIAIRGGLGEISYYTSTLTSSNDVTNYLITMPGMDKSQDYAHADIWLGYDADQMVWPELYEWLIEHSRGHRWRNNVHHK